MSKAKKRNISLKDSLPIPGSKWILEKRCALTAGEPDGENGQEAGGQFMMEEMRGQNTPVFPEGKLENPRARGQGPPVWTLE